MLNFGITETNTIDSILFNGFIHGFLGRAISRGNNNNDVRGIFSSRTHIGDRRKPLRIIYI